MVSAVLLPWWVSQSVQVLLIPADGIEELTSVAREQILERQSQMELFFTIAPRASGVLFFSGLFLLVWGVWEWRRRQLVQDDTENFARDAAQRGLETGTLEERQTALQEEADQALEDDASVHAHVSGSQEPSTVDDSLLALRKRDALNQVRAVEAEAMRILEEFANPLFDVVRNVRVESAAKKKQVLDAVLVPNASGYSRIFVEIRLVRSTDNLHQRVSASRDLIRAALREQSGPESTDSIGLVILVLDANIRLDFIKSRLDKVQDLEDQQGPIVYFVPVGELELYRMDRRHFLSVLRRSVDDRVWGRVGLK